VKDAVLNLIYRDREGEPIDRDQLKTVIRIFVDCGLEQVPTKQSTANQGATGPKEEVSLKMYEQDFEAEFLAQTREYYQNKSALWTAQDTFPDYLRKAENLYEDEKQRRADFLDESTESKLLTAIDDELVGAHQTTLLNNPDSGYTTLLTRFNETNGSDLEDLRRVYRLFKRLAETEDSGIIPVSNQTRDFITKVGLGVVGDCECKLKLKDGQCDFDQRGRPSIEDNLDELIAKLANRYQLYEMLVNDVFEKDVHFLKALKAGFDSVMNQQIVDKPEYTDQRGQVKSAKLKESAVMLADYIAQLLSKTGNDDEILPQIQTCVSLFTHLRQKDLYIKCHERHLAQRLLTRKGINMDWEQQAVQWIKVHTGARMVSNMEVMIQDMQYQESLNSAWTNAAESDQGNVHVDGIGKVKMDVKVLTAGKWPSYDLAECASIRPHPAIAKCFSDFSEWYLASRPKIMLEPFWKLSTCELACYFTGKKKLVSMNIPMACILLLFAENPSRKFSVEQIKELVGYAPASVGKDIETMFKNNRHPEKKLLRLWQADRKVHHLENNDGISLNDRYKPGKAARIDMTSFDVKIPDDQVESILNQTLAERKDYIDACIVRNIKREKTLNHQQLMNKVIRELQNSFPCPPEAVTMRITGLSDGSHPDGVLLKKISEDEYEYQPAGQG
jgi:cullin 1